MRRKHKGNATQAGRGLSMDSVGRPGYTSINLRYNGADLAKFGHAEPVPPARSGGNFRSMNWDRAS